MCDQDHFDEDLQEYEARGLVTRRQFGVLVGAGIAMMLPQVVNAVDGHRVGRHGDHTRRHRRLLLRPPGQRHGAGRADLAGHLRAASRHAPDGQAARRIGLCGAGRESLLPRRRRRRPRRPARRHPSPTCMPLAQGLNETTHTTDAKAFVAWLDQQPSVAKNRKIGTQGYCMGGPIAFRTAAAVPDRVGAVASFHGGGLVTDAPNSPHLQAAEDQGAVPDRDRRQRRPARAQREERAEGDVREGEPAGGDRGVRGRGARLVPAGFRASTTSRRPRRRGAACSRCTERRSPSALPAPPTSVTSPEPGADQYLQCTMAPLLHLNIAYARVRCAVETIWTCNSAGSSAWACFSQACTAAPRHLTVQQEGL